MTEEGSDITVDNPVPPQITLQHLKNVLTIIQTSSKRGAFNADELELVGSTYRSIKDFLEHSITKSKPAESNESDNSNDPKEV